MQVVLSTFCTDIIMNMKEITLLVSMLSVCREVIYIFIYI